MKLSKNFSIYGLLGFGNLYGLGFAWQQNYNENGLMVGWRRGIALNENAFGSFSVSYQWILKESSTFLSLGISSYAYEDLPVVTIMVDIMSMVDIMRWYMCLQQSFLLIRDFNMQNV